MEKEGETHYRISYLWIGILLFSSLIADAATLIPLVGDFVGPIYWILASIYLWYSGHGLVNWRRLVPTLISFIGELIPLVQELPTIIAAVIAIIFLSRIEDKTGLSLIPTSPQKEKELMDLAKRVKARRPLNEDRVRMPQKETPSDGPVENNI